MSIAIREHWFMATFHYIPSIDLAVAETELFGCAVVGMLVSILTAKNKPMFIWILFVCACLEAIGYGARVYCAQNADLATFIVQAVVILVVPIAIALVNYIVVGILLEASGQQIMCLTPTRVARLFFVSDVGAFFLQAGGASMMANEASADFGQNLALIGVVIQLCFFTGFVCLIQQVAYGKHFQLYSIPQLADAFRVIYATSSLLYIRNLYRAIEFIDRHGFMATNEWVFVLFEPVAIALCFVAYSHWNFGRVLPGSEAELVAIVSMHRERTKPSLDPEAARHNSNLQAGAGQEGPAAAPSSMHLSA